MLGPLKLPFCHFCLLNSVLANQVVILVNQTNQKSNLWVHFKFYWPGIYGKLLIRAIFFGLDNLEILYKIESDDICRAAPKFKPLVDYLLHIYDINLIG